MSILGKFGGAVKRVASMITGGRSDKWLARERDVSAQASTTPTAATTPDNAAAAAAMKPARHKRHRGAKDPHSQRTRKFGMLTPDGWKTPHDIRIAYLMGMRLDKIRQFWGRRAAELAVA